MTTASPEASPVRLGQVAASGTDPPRLDARSMLTMRPPAPIWPIWLTCVPTGEVRLAAIAADMFAALIGARADGREGGVKWPTMFLSAVKERAHGRDVRAPLSASGGVMWTRWVMSTTRCS